MYPKLRSVSVTLLANLILVSHCLSVSPFRCKSNLPYDFLNIERFTDNMCAQCFWYMAGVESAWKRFDIVSKWYIMYNFSDYINALVCRPECSQFKFRYLNKNDRENDPILNEFNDEFHMVCQRISTQLSRHTFYACPFILKTRCF